MSKYCPVCGGRLIYEGRVRRYVCQSCGTTYTLEELIEEREKIRRLTRAEEDARKREMREYLKWWLSSEK